jgi:hypothetical protein
LVADGRNEREWIYVREVPDSLLYRVASLLPSHPSTYNHLLSYSTFMEYPRYPVFPISGANSSPALSAPPYSTHHTLTYPKIHPTVATTGFTMFYPDFCDQRFTRPVIPTITNSWAEMTVPQVSDLLEAKHIKLTFEGLAKPDYRVPACSTSPSSIRLSPFDTSLYAFHRQSTTPFDMVSFPTSCRKSLIKPFFIYIMW